MLTLSGPAWVPFAGMHGKKRSNNANQKNREGIKLKVKKERERNEEDDSEQRGTSKTRRRSVSRDEERRREDGKL